ncbi:MAG: YicC family protein [Clostridia bacterium]|nr:YicC family protein [Clostridia bacterium]
MRSMTAFGRATVAGEGYELTVELRSVNNRYLDLNFRLPRAWAAQEERIKAALSTMGVSRGKVDISVILTDTRAQSGAALLEPDLDVARRYVEAARLLCEELNVDHDLTTSRLLTLPGVMVPVKEDTAEDDDTVWEKLSPAVTEAVAAFLAAREREGARLAADVLAKLEGIRALVATIAARSAENVAAYRIRFEERLRAALGETGAAFDENRIITECAIYADRVAIDEELVRLASHFDALEGLFKSSEAVGRKIDFMLQETNREINTIGSKCSDAAMAQTVAEVKSELEKIREQIQNIE